jgi:WXG100 family type VII secretion target
LSLTDQEIAMTEYTFDPSRAEAVLQQLEVIDNQIRAMLNTLDENSKRNLAGWASETQQAYTQAKAAWDASAAAMPQALQNARSALTQIAHTYHRMEINGSSLFQAR